MTEPTDLGGCKWISTFEHARLTLSERKANAETITCCGCKAKVPYVDSWVTLPLGRHGNRLPLPVFVHCQNCAETKDATKAYQAAWANDKQAAEPDPEKLKREEEINRKAREAMRLN